jgi:hypothetical protein
MSKLTVRILCCRISGDAISLTHSLTPEHVCEEDTVWSWERIKVRMHMRMMSR